MSVGDSLTFRGQTDLEAEVSVTGSWATFTHFTVAGLQVAQHASDTDLYYVERYVGERNVPSDVRRLRRSVYEVMRRMGQPVIVKHMYNDRDARMGVAKASPVGYDAYGQQVRNRDPYSYGTGYCSVQVNPKEWIDPNSGAIVTSDTSPGPNFPPAPMYRGYGPGFLTFIIQPDVAMDAFKLAPNGALIKVQDQTVQAPWWPEINDNDLIINVEMDNRGNIVDTHERYQAKMTQPVSIRGLDNRGRRESRNEFGNRHGINQQFEMSLLPQTSVLYQVETDR